MRNTRGFALCAALAWAAWAGPVDFGRQEYQRAAAERKLAPARSRVQTEVSGSVAAESFSIRPGLISGGDNRGLMYGLLEAAEQIRSRGRLVAVKASPAMPIRGVRVAVQPDDLRQDWYKSRDAWQQFLAMLARNRFNRLNLVFERQAIDVVAGEQNIEILRYVSRIAVEYAVDFTLGIPLDADQRMSEAMLLHLLSACPSIRGVQIGVAAGSGETQAGSLNWLFRAIREAGRRVTLELRDLDLTPGMLEAAMNAEVPLRISAKYGERQSALPARPAACQLFWEVERASEQRLMWTDPGFVRRTVPAFAQSGGAGFEIEAPAPPDSQSYGLFYRLWGRLSYDPKTPESVFGKEIKAR